MIYVVSLACVGSVQRAPPIVVGCDSYLLVGGSVHHRLLECRGMCRLWAEQVRRCSESGWLGRQGHGAFLCQQSLGLASRLRAELCRLPWGIIGRKGGSGLEKGSTGEVVGRQDPIQFHVQLTLANSSGVQSLLTRDE